MTPKMLPGLDRATDLAAAKRPDKGSSDDAALWSALVDASRDGDGLDEVAVVPTAEQRPADAASEGAEVPSTPSPISTVGAASFYLPVFLQGPPKAGNGVVAGQENATAELTQHPSQEAVPVGSTVSSRPLVQPDDAPVRLPSFLVAAGAGKTAATPGDGTQYAAPDGRPGTNAPLSTIPVGPIAALRSAIQALSPMRSAPGDLATLKVGPPGTDPIHPEPLRSERMGAQPLDSVAGSLRPTGLLSGRVDLQKPTDVQRLGSSPTVGAAARTSPVDRANPPSGSSSVPGGIPALFDLWAGNTASAGTSRDPGAESILTDAPLVVLHEPVGTDAWQDQLGAQLSVMAMAGGESEAVMKLAPEDLGELEIRVMIRDGEASLQFGATNAEAREAIETAQPRLRELFTSQGMDISNFSVFSNLSGNSHSFSKNGAVPPRPERGVPATQEDLQVRVTRRAPQGIIDLYA